MDPRPSGCREGQNVYVYYIIQGVLYYTGLLLVHLQGNVALFFFKLDLCTHIQNYKAEM